MPMDTPLCLECVIYCLPHTLFISSFIEPCGIAKTVETLDAMVQDYDAKTV